MTLSMIVEWSKGSLERFDWSGEKLVFRQLWEDAPPINYGLVPGILNPADNAEVDAVWPGEPVAPGTRLEGELMGMVWLTDGDHKLILGHALSEEETAALIHWPTLAWRSPRIAGLEEARGFLKMLKHRLRTR